MTKMESEGKKKTQFGYRRVWVMICLLLTVSSFVVSSLSLLCCGLVVAENFYGTGTVEDAVMKLTKGYDQCLEAVDVLRDYILDKDVEGALQYFATKNLDVNLLYEYAAPAGEERRSDIIFGTYDGSYPATLTYDYTIIFDKRISVTLQNGRTKYIYPERTYYVRVYVNPLFPYEDSMHLFYNILTILYEMRYVLVWTVLAGGMGTVLGFVLLMYSTDKYRDGTTSAQTEKKGIFWDVLLVVFPLGLWGILHWAEHSFSMLPDRDLLRKILLVTFSGMGVIIWITVFCYQIVYQIRFGKGWSNTLIHALLQGIKSFVRIGIWVIKKLPLVSATVLAYLLIFVLEFLGAAFFLDGKGDILWLLDKLILFPVVIYVALCCKRLLSAGKALAEGQLDHTVNTEGMIGELKKHGSNLNSIGLGITRAVEERTKSERLKTELITNISHDLKTPLTSIINYSDLICQERSENENITEYSQVLRRQSGRLKKLLEDLVEASKVVTGNLEIDLVPCEVGVILSQAVGEYQQRLEEKELELHITQPEQPVQIMADGKQLWRVFDNLLNNIYKYAQEKSRVYLSVELQESQVLIIFRNMSKYVLNVSAEELEERFVRGDKSRHMEGNGLGLSIAKSLLELQDGSMRILIDGDLFKVTLSFQVLDEKQK